MTNAERTRRYRERNKISASFAMANAERARLRRRKYKVYLESLCEEQRRDLIEQQRLQNRTNQRNRRNRLKQASQGGEESSNKVLVQQLIAPPLMEGKQFFISLFLNAVFFAKY
jgi:hypothetical protein